MVVFGKKSFKCFIEFNDAKNFRSSCIFFLKMSRYRRDIHETKSSF